MLYFNNFPSASYNPTRRAGFLRYPDFQPSTASDALGEDGPADYDDLIPPYDPSEAGGGGTPQFTGIPDDLQPRSQRPPESDASDYLMMNVPHLQNPIRVPKSRFQQSTPYPRAPIPLGPPRSPYSRAPISIGNPAGSPPFDPSYLNRPNASRGEQEEEYPSSKRRRRIYGPRGQGYGSSPYDR